MREKILVVTPELTYYSLKGCRYEIVKAGGLADVTATLVESLRERGLRVYVAAPFFHNSGLNIPDFEKENLFLVADERYSNNNGPYEKNIEEFSLAFQSGVLNHVIPRIKPDIIHAHDWPTGFVGPLAGTKSLFTIHNVHTKTAHIEWMRDMQLPLMNKERLWLDNFDLAKVNFLMSGIFGSGYCNTPSQKWLEEILSGDVPINAPEGFGQLMKSKNAHGILNSPDRSYDPETDIQIHARYGISGMAEGKLANKLAFQQNVGLEVRKDSHLVVWTNRADPNQKGIDLLNNIAARLMVANQKLQMAIISDGNYIPQITETISKINTSGRQIVVRAFSDFLERNAYAAADGVMNFSRYAPCEIAHMKGAKYGAISIVRAVGGAAQTVYDYRKEGASGVPGIITHNYTGQSMLESIESFIELANSKSFDRVRNKTMDVAKKEFTPEKMADSYIRLYKQMIAKA
jgi:glycogen synthase